jgi:hypothetical protein
MSAWQRRVGVALGLVLVGWLLSGCQGAGSELAAGLRSDPAPLALGSGQELPAAESAPLTLPPLAELDRLAAERRQTSEVFSYEPIIIRGDAWFTADADAVKSTDWDAAELPADADEATWAVYGFSGLAPDAPLGYLEALIGDATEQTLYYALADYGAGSWRWFSLHVPDLRDLEGSFSRALEDGRDYISAAGGLYFAVATFDAASCQVRRVALSVGVRQVYVQGLSASDGASGSAITIGWQALPGAAGYELYFRLADFPGPLLLLTAVDGGETTAFVHDDTAPPEYPAQKDTAYIYFIMAVFPDGYRSQLSGWDTGYCGELP